MLDRRQCLQSLAAFTSLAAAGSAAETAAPSASSSRILIFSKPLQHLGFKEAADWLVRWDVGGLETTVRRDGWIDTSMAAEKLPELFDIMSAAKRTGMIVTSDVNEADHPDVDRVLKVA